MYLLLIMTTPEAYWQYNVSDGLVRYGMPVVFAIGLVGNTLVVATTLQKKVRQKPYALGLAILALVDMTFLIINMIQRYIVWVFGPDLPAKFFFSKTACQLHAYIGVVVTQIPPWTIVLVTCERVISVNVPFKAKTWVTRKRIVLIWLCIVAIIMISNIWPFFVVQSGGHELGHPSRPCTMPSATVNSIIYHVTITTLSCLLPFLLILSGNLGIIYGLRKAIKRRKAMVQGANQENVTRNIDATNMVLTVTMMYLILMLPLALYKVIYDINSQVFASDRPFGMAYNYMFAHFFGSFMHNCNSAINFILYALAGRQFRESFKKLFQCKKLTVSNIHVRGN